MNCVIHNVMGVDRQHTNPGSIILHTVCVCVYANGTCCYPGVVWEVTLLHDNFVVYVWYLYCVTVLVRKGVLAPGINLR